MKRRRKKVETAMKSKKCNKRLVTYELRNLLGNPFVYIFGIIFPILMLIIITRAIAEETVQEYIPYANTAVFISMSLIVPMAVILLGYSANYSQELEKEIPLRMELFGYSAKSVLVSKVIAHFLVTAAGLLFYTVIACAVLDLQTPKISSVICLVICHILLGLMFFALAHGVSVFFKKFGPTYAVMMGLYFGIMILCGMMGVKTEQLPKVARLIANLLPMTYISNDFIQFWTEGSYNFVPLIQAFLFLGAISGIVLVFALQKSKRKQAN